jgi:hypothetical protein
VSEILRIIDAYRDANGQMADAAVARALNFSPQALSSLRKRGGLHTLAADQYPWLERLAVVTHLPYPYVLSCALYDVGLVPEKPEVPATAPAAYQKGA